MRARATLIVGASVIALSGCRDSGLPDRNLPQDEAAHRAPAALVQAVHPESRADAPADAPPARVAPGEHADGAMASLPVSVGDQTFQRSGGPMRLEAAALRPVGSGATGGTFSVASWDQPPYDRLYLSHPGGLYVTYLPMHDAAGDPAARAAAARRTLEEGGAGH